MSKPHIAPPNWFTFCGLPPSPTVLAYDTVSLDYGDWCPECARLCFLRGWDDEKRNRYFGWGILPMAEGLQQGMTGAGEPLASVEFWDAYAYLMFRLHTWRPSGAVPWAGYDEGARLRVAAVVKMVSSEWGQSMGTIPPRPTE